MANESADRLLVSAVMWNFQDSH